MRTGFSCDSPQAYAAAGQERKLIPGARHLACTVEMADTTRSWDAAVVGNLILMHHKGIDLSQHLQRVDTLT